MIIIPVKKPISESEKQEALAILQILFADIRGAHS